MSQASQKPVAFVTMGCRTNQFESERMRHQCQKADLNTTQDLTQAKTIVINTCSVTAESDRQARQLIRRLARRHPHAQLIVTGCYAQRDPETLAGFEQVQWVLGNQEKQKIAQFIQPPSTVIPISPDKTQVSPFKEEGTITLPPALENPSEKARAYVQIQSGCDEQCTFCIIPILRGPSRSYKPEKVYAQVEALLKTGVQELVLTGINLGSYGQDFSPSITLTQLIKEIITYPKLKQLRISSLAAADIDPSLIDLFRVEKKLCPHLHISIQSGDDLILKRMHRRDRRQQIVETIKQLRLARPDMIFGADIIVGFPTESEEAFDNTLRLMIEGQIALPHVFRYSQRPETPAARFPQKAHIHPTIIKKRAFKLREAGLAILFKQAEKICHTIRPLLIEQINSDQNRLSGKLDNYLTIQVTLKKTEVCHYKAGMIIPVQITHFDQDPFLLHGKIPTTSLP
ncbi:tRNA (N(6)-L-threonylcarbamoyladenosine(37)-C(2))-methylthiotransferase MtaB [Magnetococcales bacterium HHB-1]